MTDLAAVLPNFPTHQYARLISILERNNVSTADLLTLDSVELAKQARPLTIPDAKLLSNAVKHALQISLGIDSENASPVSSFLKKDGARLLQSWNTISTLDDDLDTALGGGIPTEYITEVTGESGAGKTQFLLTLLLSCQLPPPHGLGASAMYVSTESALPTTRLASMISSHPVLSRLAPADRPSLDKIISFATPDLESQDHILRYQVPVAVQRYGVKLIILDSVAANYRAEFDRPGLGNTGGGGGKNMAQRSSELVTLGDMLRKLAREHDLAVVVANQVADRFSGGSDAGAGDNSPFKRSTQSSPLDRRSGRVMPQSSVGAPLSSMPAPETPQARFNGTPDPMCLDHQQRWFTGWGDDPSPSRLARMGLKTPSLGLVWTTQIACRIALIKRPVYGAGIGLVVDEETDRGEPVLRKWRRWMKVVFAPHAKATSEGLDGAVEFEIRGAGIFAVKGAKDDDDE